MFAVFIQQHHSHTHVRSQNAIDLPCLPTLCVLSSELPGARRPFSLFAAEGLYFFVD